jgi:hypothetical protein
VQVRGQRARRRQVVAERLLDRDAPLALHQPGVGQSGDHGGEQRGRDLQVEHRVGGVAERAGDRMVSAGVAEVAAHVGEALGKPDEDGVVDRLAGGLDGLTGMLAQLLA